MSNRPGWTKTPNDIYAAMSDMSEAELRVTLALVRHTYGFHKDECRLTYKDFRAETGLASDSSVQVGLEAVVKRGFFQHGNGRSRWAIANTTLPVVNGAQENTTEDVDTTEGVAHDSTESVAKVTTGSVVNTSGSSKEIVKENTTPPTPQIGGGGADEDYRIVVKIYEQEIGIITRGIAGKIVQALECFTPDVVNEAIILAAENNVRKWTYVNGILERWQREGRGRKPYSNGHHPKTVKIIDVDGSIKEVPA